MKNRHPLSYVWSGMIRRCYNKNVPDFHRYGGRGIKVCDRWRSLKNFAEDMGERPEGTSIDRVNNDGNYEPGNCRWATRKEQSANTRTFGRFRDITGSCFGQITPMKMIGRGPSGRVYWRVQCSCGTFNTARYDNIISGKSTSCGCRQWNSSNQL